MDEFLKSYIDKYDRWFSENRISYSSRVIPVKESLEGVKHMIPTIQARDILAQARVITIADCLCRSRYKNCDRPREVCFILNGAGEQWIEKGLSKKINLDQAGSVLKKANQSGLVHMTLYRPDHKVFALCSCCSCCCHDLQLVLGYGKDYIMLKSDYIARSLPEECLHCGQCVDRCQFNARQMTESGMVYDPEKCSGCGLCITPCPGNAIEMNRREQ